MVRRTKEDAQVTRNHILDTAVEVFNHKGVAHTSLNDIAREAGVTRGAIYWHFADKVNMFDAMIERLVCPLMINAEDREARIKADPLGFILFARNIDAPDRAQDLVEELRSCVARAELLLVYQQFEDSRPDEFLPRARTDHVYESNHLFRRGHERLRIGHEPRRQCASRFEFCAVAPD